MLIFEYLKFIFKLYGAEPLAGMEYLHGKKGYLWCTWARWTPR
ncbi:MAG: hypothetical protein ACE5LU_26615 [Anaerolineae bacterium]